jgi:hypothetical protein
MSAENVWECIKTYRTSDSKTIDRKFGGDKAVITALATYGGKNDYHGHQSGHPGEGTSADADANLDKAIAFLNHAKVPEKPEKKGPDPEKKAASIKSSAQLIAIIKKESNLGTLREKLDEENPKWKDIKDVWNEFDVKYFEKKKVHPKK